MLAYHNENKTLHQAAPNASRHGGCHSPFPSNMHRYKKIPSGFDEIKPSSAVKRSWIVRRLLFCVSILVSREFSIRTNSPPVLPYSPSEHAALRRTSQRLAQNRGHLFDSDMDTDAPSVGSFGAVLACLRILDGYNHLRWELFTVRP